MQVNRHPPVERLAMLSLLSNGVHWQARTAVRRDCHGSNPAAPAGSAPKVEFILIRTHFSHGFCWRPFGLPAHGSSGDGCGRRKTHWSDRTIRCQTRSPSSSDGPEWAETSAKCQLNAGAGKALGTFWTGLQSVSQVNRSALPTTLSCANLGLSGLLSSECQRFCRQHLRGH